MRRGTSDRETCDLNGWSVGTVVRGHEVWPNGQGVWTTWRITALGEAMVLARTVRSERTYNGKVTQVDERIGWEHSVTFTDRDWAEEDA